MPRLSACASGMPRPGAAAPVSKCRRVVAEQVAGRHLAVLEGDFAADAMLPRLVMRFDANARRVGRHQQHARRRPPGNLHQNREQPGDRRIGDAVFHAVDDPIIAGLGRCSLHRDVRGPPAGDN